MGEIFEIIEKVPEAISTCSSVPQEVKDELNKLKNTFSDPTKVAL
jgi:hypothetical protein